MLFEQDIQIQILSKNKPISKIGFILHHRAYQRSNIMN
jgi:hypothetical protein